MPIANIQDAREVQCGLQNIFDAPDADERARTIRALFVETLDFDQADRLVPLGSINDPDLPADARLLGRRNGFSVLYVALDGADENRVKTATAAAAAKLIGDAIADEPLLLFTNRDCDQPHVIYPELSGSRPRLQRMVIHRDRPARTIIQQIANLWHDYGELGLHQRTRLGPATPGSPDPAGAHGPTGNCAGRYPTWTAPSPYSPAPVRCCQRATRRRRQCNHPQPAPTPQRQHLVPCIRSARCVSQIRVIVHQLARTQMMGQRNRQDQSGIGHQTVIVEGDTDAVRVVAW